MKYKLVQSAINLIQFGKLTSDRQRTWLYFCASVLFLTLFPAAGALGLIVVMGIVWRNRYREILRSYLNRALIGLTGILIFSSASAEYPLEAWLGLANFVPYFALFMALECLFSEPIQLKQLSWLLILPSLPIVILGLGQLLFAWDTPSWIESILGWEIVPLGVPPGRMSSVFNYTNFLAIYLAIALMLAIGLWLENWQRAGNFKVQTLLTTILLADISGLILTSSRNAWGLAIFSLIAYAFYLGWRWLVWGVVGMAIAILWASFVPTMGGTQLRRIVPSFIWTRLSDQLHDRPVETLRITQWQFCWDLIKDRPIFGWGLRNFSPLYEAKYSLWLGHPHSLFLMFNAEAGTIALLLLSGIVGSIMFKAVRLLATWCELRSQLIFFSYLITFTSCILFNLADVTIFDLRVNTIIWIILAAISGITKAQSQTENSQI